MSRLNRSDFIVPRARSTSLNVQPRVYSDLCDIQDFIVKRRQGIPKNELNNSPPLKIRSVSENMDTVSTGTVPVATNSTSMTSAATNSSVDNATSGDIASGIPAVPPVPKEPTLPPVSLNFIEKISVSALAQPLYDGTVNPLTSQFQAGQTNIWELSPPSSSQNPQIAPAALDPTATFTVTVGKTELGMIQGLQSPFTVTVTLDSGNAFFEFKKPIDVLELTLENLTIAEQTAGGQSKSLPWAFLGPITWTIKGSDPKRPPFTCKTKIETYVFPKNVAPYFQTSGIPLALLREPSYLQKWMKVPDPSNTKIPWASFAITRLFSDPRLQYQRWDGLSRYSNWGFPPQFLNHLALDPELEFCLDLWVSDMTVATLNNIVYPVSCYDLAILGQILVSLGYDASINNLRIKYMDPFGYINPVLIIGKCQYPPPTEEEAAKQNLCNNPYYGCPGTDPRRNCPPESGVRSKLNDCLFISITNEEETYVLDPCFGPETGTTKLLDYPTKAIDNSPLRYNGRSRPGTVADIADMTGTKYLVHSCCLNNTVAPDSSKLLGQINAHLKEVAVENWQFHIFSPLDDRSITATWTYVPQSNTKELVTITISTYPKFWMVNNAFSKLTSNIPKWDMSNVVEGWSDIFNGSIRVFCDASRHFLATVEAKLGKSKTTADIESKLQGLLASNLRQYPDPITFIQKVESSSSAGINSVGDIVTVSLTVSSFIFLSKTV